MRIWTSTIRACCCHWKNIERVRNCPDVKIINSLFGLCLLSFCLLYFCLFVFPFFVLFFCLVFCLLFFFFSFCRFWHHSGQISEGSQVSKVTLCVKILKWQWPTQSLTKVRYRAARAAKDRQQNSIDWKFKTCSQIIVHVVNIKLAISCLKGRFLNIFTKQCYNEKFYNVAQWVTWLHCTSGYKSKLDFQD